MCVSLFHRYCNWLYHKWPSWSWSYDTCSWITNFLCNQCLSRLKLWDRIPLGRYNIIFKLSFHDIAVKLLKVMPKDTKSILRNACNQVEPGVCAVVIHSTCIKRDCNFHFCVNRPGSVMVMLVFVASSLTKQHQWAVKVTRGVMIMRLGEAAYLRTNRCFRV